MVETTNRGRQNEAPCRNSFERACWQIDLSLKRIGSFADLKVVKILY